jgi:hypothetical protein
MLHCSAVDDWWYGSKDHTHAFEAISYM